MFNNIMQISDAEITMDSSQYLQALWGHDHALTRCHSVACPVCSRLQETEVQGTEGLEFSVLEETVSNTLEKASSASDIDMYTRMIESATALMDKYDDDDGVKTASWFKGQPASNASEMYTELIKSADALFAAMMLDQINDAYIVGWFRGQPASMMAVIERAASKHVAIADPEIAGWFRGQPASNATDAEITGWFKGQPHTNVAAALKAVQKERRDFIRTIFTSLDTGVHKPLTMLCSPFRCCFFNFNLHCSTLCCIFYRCSIH